MSYFLINLSSEQPKYFTIRSNKRKLHYKTFKFIKKIGFLAGSGNVPYAIPILILLMITSAHVVNAYDTTSKTKHLAQKCACCVNFILMLPTSVDMFYFYLEIYLLYFILYTATSLPLVCLSLSLSILHALCCVCLSFSQQQTRPVLIDATNQIPYL